MGSIKNRIDREYKKHNNLDWSKIAEAKICNDFRELVNYIFKSYRNKTDPEIQSELIERIHKIKDYTNVENSEPEGEKNGK